MAKYVFLAGMAIAAIAYWIILFRSFKDKE